MQAKTALVLLLGKDHERVRLPAHDPRPPLNDEEVVIIKLKVFRELGDLDRFPST